MNTNLTAISQNKEKSVALKTMEDGQVMLYSVSTAKYEVMISFDVHYGICVFCDYVVSNSVSHFCCWF